MSGLIVDLFAGGGGASTGIEAALGRTVDIAINHSAIALAVHQANHPGTKHLTADIWEVKPSEAVEGRPVDLLWASPDCTHFSVAKGGKPRKQNIRSLAWAVCRWAADTRPKVIALENVAEFKGWGPLDTAGKPIKTKMGQTFLRWKRRLENLGYVVDFKILDASHFGAPTRRRRLFLIARRDGLPIRWPMPTHGAKGSGLLPFRTAAECIDWSLACPSIFERKKPLAEKTLWRIAQGIKRFVIENPKPFILKFQENSVGQRMSEPLDTVMAGAPRFGVVSPVVAGVGGRAGQSEATAGDAPVGTITAKNDRVIVAPSLVKVNHGGEADRAESIEEPLTTVTAARRGHAVIAPTLVTIDHGSSPRGSSAADSPLPTTTTENRHATVAATLIQTGYGEREGQAARVPGVGKPLGTVVAGGQKHGIVAASLMSHYGASVAADIEQPTPTVTAGGGGKQALVGAFISRAYGEAPGKWKGAGSADIAEALPTVTTQDHNNLAAVALAKFRGTAGQKASQSLDEPMPTIAAGGTHTAEVCAFLVKYYGTAVGQDADKPLSTVTAKDRLGLVTVEGVQYEIVDIGLRMLEPHELLAAQFGKYATRYDLSFAKTKAAKVRLIGNSVCPEVAEAVIRANFLTVENEVAA